MNTTPRGARRRTLAALVSTALLTSACSGAAQDTSEPAAVAGLTAGSRLVIAENEPPASFDPALADNSTVDEVVIPVYDALLQYDSDNVLQPALATDWSV